MKILVTGGNGLCGEAIKRKTEFSSHTFDFINRSEYDLRKQSDVDNLFNNFMLKHGSIDAVIHTAARVGGIGANLKYPESFLSDNLLMNVNMINNCIRWKVSRLFAFSSVCVFPDNLSLLEEDKINDGPVYGANFAYGYAKRMVDVHIRAARIQHGVKNWTSIIPGNIYGPHDMYSIEDGHIIPALVHKMFIAKRENKPLTMWGDGLSMREFIYVDDLAEIILRLLEKDNLPDKVLISGRKEHSIKEVTETLAKVAGFDGDILWDETKPNGQRSRPSSSEVLESIIPQSELKEVYTDLEEGLARTWLWFNNNYPNIRTKYNA